MFLVFAAGLHFILLTRGLNEEALHCFLRTQITPLLANVR